jgi:hypothetical protein
MYLSQRTICIIWILALAYGQVLNVRAAFIPITFEDTKGTTSIKNVKKIIFNGAILSNDNNGQITLLVSDSDTLDNLDSTQFLRSDTSTAYTNGTITFNTSTNVNIGSNNLSIADSDISFTGTNTIFRQNNGSFSLIPNSGSNLNANLSGGGRLKVTGLIEAERIKLTSNPFNNYILVSDSTGNGNWTNPSTLLTNGNVSLNALKDSISDAQSNLFLGNGAGLVHTGKFNTGVGINALNSLGAGNGNVAFGYSAGNSLNNAFHNILIGDRAGLGMTSGNNNIFIGNVNGSSTTASNELNIGNLLYGNFSSGNIGIGVENPANFKLELAGNLGPNVDITYDLGSNSRKFKEAFIRDITISNNGSIANNLAVTNTITANKAIFTNNINGANLFISNNGSIANNLAVGNRITANKAIFTNNINGANLFISNNGSIANNLAVGNRITANKAIFTNNINGANLFISNNGSIANNLAVTNTITANKAIFTNNVNGNIANFITGNFTTVNTNTINANTLSTNFLNGSIIFASETGNLMEDNNNFFWDRVNNRLGIGTKTPKQKLDVNGNIRITGGSPAKDKVLASLDSAGNGYWMDISTILTNGDAFLNALKDSISDAQSNLFLGNGAGLVHTGKFNTGVGINALTKLTTGNGNVAFGYTAGNGLTSGFDNILLGKNAGVGMTSGNNNIFIGNVNGSSTTASNELNIGNLFYGNFSSGNIGIGVENPANFKLELAGNLGPNVDITYDLGSNSRKFKEAFIRDITISNNGSIANNLAVGNRITANKAIFTNNINGANLFISNNGSIANNLAVGNRITANKAIFTNNINGANLFISNNGSIANNLAVTNTITANKAIFTNNVNGNIANFITGNFTTINTNTLNANTLSTNFLNGSIIFANAVGNLMEDNNNFFWDKTNNRLGIGTKTPSNRVSIVANQPAQAELEIRQNSWATGDYTGIQFAVTQNSINQKKAAIFFERKNSKGRGSLLFATNNIDDNGNVSITDVDMTITAAGNIGIGTTTPKQKLDVNGNIRITGGSPAKDKVLASLDSGGNGYWMDISTILTNGDSFLNALKDSISDAQSNLFLGNGAGLVHTGKFNTGVGINALTKLTTGNGNVALGYTAGNGLTSGFDNILLGKNAGVGMTSGNNNIFIGNVNGSSTTASNELNIGNLFYGNFSSGNIGIGVENPANFKLELAGNLGPNVDITYDLGSNSRKFKEAFIRDITISNNGSIANNLAVTNTITANKAIFTNNINGANLFISNNGSIANNLAVGNRITANKAIFTNNINGANLFISNNGSIANNLAVTNRITANKAIFTNNVNGNIANFITGNFTTINTNTLNANTLSTNFLNGSIIFANAVGNLMEDNNNFFWDKTNNRLGIGTKTPSNRVSIVANQAAQAELEIRQNSNDTGDFTGIQFAVTPNETNRKKAAIFFQKTDSKGRGSLLFATNNIDDNGNVSITDVDMTITAAGNIGIGTTTPQQKLDVNGKILAVTGIFTNNVNGNVANFTTGNFTTINASTLNASTLTTNLTNGSIIFANAVGNLMEDNNNFFWDKTNNRLGIGTKTPSNRVSIVADQATQTELEIRQKSNDIGDFTGIQFAVTPNETNRKKAAIFFQKTDSKGRGSLLFATNNIDDNGNVSITDVDMTITAAGNIGIGTTTPKQKLDVNGNIRITGGSPAKDKVLASLDSGGNGYWMDISTILTNGDSFLNALKDSISDAQSNLFLGNGAGLVHTGKFNTGVGINALTKLTTGNGNVALGYTAGNGLTSGFDNILLGKNAGVGMTSGNNNIFIGNVNGSSTTASNELNIGNLFYGNFSSGNIGIGVENPANFKLELAGNLGPNVDITYDLGSNSRKFKEAFIRDITISNNGSIANNLAVGNRITANKAIFTNNINGANLFISNNGSISNNLAVGNRITANKAIFTNNINGANLFISNNGSIANNLAVTNRITANKAIFTNNVNGNIANFITGNFTTINTNTLNANTLSTNFLNGSIIFANAVGNLMEDNNNFFWDKTNNRLGIGTKTPSNRVSIVANQPAQAELEIRQNSNDTGDFTGIQFAVTPNETNRKKAAIFFQKTDSKGRGSLLFATNNIDDDGNVSITDVDMTITAAGNIGIGTTTPKQKLDVNGNIRITGGSPAKDKVLASLDSGGNGYWMDISTILTNGDSFLNALKDSISDAQSNLFLGNGAGLVHTGKFNTGVGINALTKLTTGNGNVALGYTAGNGLTSGFDNILLGKNAGVGMTSGNNNIFIGNVNGSSTTASNELNIGNLFYGNFSSGNIGIGVENPANFKLELAGNLGPNVDITYDLGSNSRKFKEAFIRDITISNNGSIANNLAVTNTITANKAIFTNNINGANLFISNNGSISNNLAVGNRITANKAIFTNNINGANLFISNNGSIANNLAVGNRITANKAIFTNNVNGNIANFITGNFTTINTNTLNANTLSTNFLNGSIIFANAVGNLMEDNNNFFWDKTNNRLGIGTKTPNTTVSIAANQATQTELEIRQKSNDIGDFTGIQFAVTPNETNRKKAAIFFQKTDSKGRGSLLFATNNIDDNGNVSITDVDMTITAAGNIGIGTTTPQQKLDVNGKILAVTGIFTNNVNGNVANFTTGNFTTINASTLNASTLTTNLTNGSIIFANAVGNLMEDNNNFFWDKTNNRLGIGTKTPSNRVSIVADQATQTELEIRQKSNDIGDFTGIQFAVTPNETNRKKAAIFFQKTDSKGRGSLLFATNNIDDNGNVSITDVDMTITAAGNIGIGTTTPKQKLDVNGNIRITGGSPAKDKVLASLDSGGNGYWMDISTILTNGDSFLNALKDSISDAQSNLFLGNGAGLVHTGKFNTGVGINALTKLTTGNGNVALGYTAGNGLTSGFDNILLGKNAGVGMTSGNNNIFIGNVNGSSTTASNELNIGNLFYGNFSSGNIGIGVENPANFKLELAGNLGPNVDITYDLGSNSRKFKEAFIRDITISNNGSIANNLAVTNTITANKAIFTNNINGANLFISNNGSISNNLAVGNRITANKAIFTNNINGANLFISNNGSIANNLAVGNRITANKAIFTNNVNGNIANFITGNFTTINTNTLNANTLSTNFLNGSIIFANAVGNLMEDNNNFFWDKTNNRLGIGTKTPNTTVSIAANQATQTELEIRQKSNDIGDFTGIQFAVTPNETNRKKAAIFFQKTASKGRGSLLFATNNIDDDGNVSITDVDMTITAAGNIGIGTTTPQQKLDVNGKILAVTGIFTNNVNGNVANFTTGNFTTINASTLNASTLTTNLTNGSIIFANAVGNLMEDNNNFFWDKTNNRLGIGTKTPSNRVSIVADQATQTELEIRQNSNDIGDFTGIQFAVTPNETNRKKAAIFFQKTDSKGRGSLLFATNNIDDDGNVSITDVDMTITAAGNIGIGTATPAYKLSVAGTADVTGFRMATGASNGRVLTSNASGVASWSDATLGGQPASSYLRSNANTTYSSGTITFSPGTSVTISSTNLTVADDNIAFNSSTGTTFTQTNTGAFTMVPANNRNFNVNLSGTGNFAVNTNHLVVNTSTTNVGIGTATPAYKFTIEGSTAVRSALKVNTNTSYSEQLHIDGSNNERWGIGRYGDNYATAALRNAYYIYQYRTRTNSVTNSLRMVITDTGNVGINHSNPTHRLQVQGTAGLSTGTTWTNTSDSRLKDIHGKYNKGLNEISQLQPVEFSYKKDNIKELPSDINIVGFIAQDVQPLFPEAVSQGEDGYLEFTMHSINVAMVNAIKELKELDAKKDLEIAKLKELDAKRVDDINNLIQQMNLMKSLMCKNNYLEEFCKP